LDEILKNITYQMRPWDKQECDMLKLCQGDTPAFTEKCSLKTKGAPSMYSVAEYESMHIHISFPSTGH
jgi:hypothetical protein